MSHRLLLLPEITRVQGRHGIDTFCGKVRSLCQDLSDSVSVYTIPATEDFDDFTCGIKLDLTADPVGIEGVICTS